MGNKPLDLIGQRFGKLTVIEKLPHYNGGKRTMWRCLCDCGNECIKRADYLTKAKNEQSCGCTKPPSKPRPNRRVDLTGSVYGHLLVTGMIYNYDAYGRSRCICKCECGNECIKDPQGLKRSRNPPHCGCMTEYYKRIQSENSRKDLTGQKFGKLTVIDMEYHHNDDTYVICECECGNIFRTKGVYLSCGDTKSCGCSSHIPESNTKDFTGISSAYGVELLCRDYKNDKGVWMWKCKCGCCGKIFTALPAKVLNGHITSCGCAKSSSRERLIESVLNDIGVNFQREYTFDDCRCINKLRFDFFVDEYNTAIEYQGEQHYRPVNLFGGDEEYEKRVERDAIKRKYCEDNGVELVCIPYSSTDIEITALLQTLFIRRDCNGLYGNI